VDRERYFEFYTFIEFADRVRFLLLFEVQLAPLLKFEKNYFFIVLLLSSVENLQLVTTVF
jgi:hypothetical protein